MKNLILCAIASLFLFTSCFEKEEEVTVVAEEEVAIVPKEGNVMECELLKRFIDYTLENSPKEPRSLVVKVLYDNQELYVLNEGGEDYADKAYQVINDTCKVVCTIGGIGGNTCPNFDRSVHLDTIWIDVR